MLRKCRYFIVFMIFSHLLPAMDYASNIKCIECEEINVSFCTQCKKFFCDNCFGEEHKGRFRRNHKCMSREQYQRYQSIIDPLTEDEQKQRLIDTYMHSLFVGYKLVHNEKDEINEVKLCFGPGFDKLIESQQIKKIVSFVSPTGSGKSFMIGAFLPNDSLKPCPALPGAHKSTTSDSAVYFEDEIAYIDLEGIGGTPTTQGAAIKKFSLAKVEELENKRRIMTFVYPPLLYSISDIMIYLYPASVGNYLPYMSDIINFGRAAATRIVNTQKPVLVICFNLRSREEIHIPLDSEDPILNSTLEWKKDFPQNVKQIEKYYSDVFVVYIPDITAVLPTTNNDPIMNFKSKILDILKSNAVDESGAVIQHQDKFAKFVQTARIFAEDPRAFINFADLYAENYAESFQSYLQLIDKNDEAFCLYKLHIERALQLLLRRWLKELYQPVTINLLGNVSCENVFNQLPESLKKLFSQRLSCQAHKEFWCESRKESFTTKCDKWLFNHKSNHGSHEAVLIEAKTDEDKYWGKKLEANNIDPNKIYNSDPCHWNGGFEAFQAVGENFEFKTLKELPLPAVNGLFKCFLCFSKLGWYEIRAGNCQICSNCQKEPEYADDLTILLEEN